jgi:transcriptional regulator with XRE-family HTH domain
VKGGQKMYSIFEELLQKHGVSTYKVSKDTGIAQSVFSSWKNGISTPKQDKMQKIADYFNVSLEYLMTGEEKEGGEKYYLNDETAKMAQEIFENKELRMLFDTARDAEPEDLQAVHSMLLALKRKERGNIDD